MLERFTSFAMTRSRSLLVAAALVFLSFVFFGGRAVSDLSAGGFLDPESESARAAAILAAEFRQGDSPYIIKLTSPSGAMSDAARAAGTSLVNNLTDAKNVAGVVSPWTAPPAMAASLLSKDGKSALILASFTGGDKAGPKDAQKFTDGFLHDYGDISLSAGGISMTESQVYAQSERDLLLMESIAMPVSFVVLVWIFGGLVAAVLPLLVAGFAIAGTLAVLHGVSLITDVSIFALNLTVALGFALAVDYTLLIVNRYREELHETGDRDEALLRAMKTAGRTILFSALTIGLVLSVLFLFPQFFLRSFAYAGLPVVALVAVAVLIITPAFIHLLAAHMESLNVHMFLRRLLGRGKFVEPPVTQHFLYRSTTLVMRHAFAVGGTVALFLSVLVLPFLGLNGGFSDDRVLPPTQSSRDVGDSIRSGFSQDPSDALSVVISDLDAHADDQLSAYAAKLSRVDDVVSVSAPTGQYVRGTRIGDAAGTTGVNGKSAFLSIASSAIPSSAQSERQLDGLHAVTPPEGAGVLFAGVPQISRDVANGVVNRLPAVLGYIALITFVLLFLLTGSVVLPLKALLLNLLSLTATFGATGWIFQDGHLQGLGTAATGFLNVPMLFVLFCIAFGLSMDYEVFLMSRIREVWLSSGATREDNDEAVRVGLARSGRVVTAAALLMVVSFVALGASRVASMRMLGVGLALAVLADATLVRMILVPALMKTMGRLNWWAPAVLARGHQRFELVGSSCAGKGAPAMGN
jgi:putative drug exporter of the RND superfamily